MRRFVLCLAALATVFAWRTAAADTAEAKDPVVVMYFHRTKRCPTCLKMGSYTEEAAKTSFAKELGEGTVAFHYVDFQDQKNAELTKAYGVAGPTRIVARASGEAVAEYRNLKEMWTKVGDKDAFLEYVRANVKSYLK